MDKYFLFDDVFIYLFILFFREAFHGSISQLLKLYWVFYLSLEIRNLEIIFATELLIVARDVNVALINRVLIATSRLVLLLVRREG